MVTIEGVEAVSGLGGYYFDDQKAMQAGATSNGSFYHGSPITKGYTKIRQPGTAVCVQLTLSSHQVAIGDCTAVVYSGVGGRDPLFDPTESVRIIEEEINELLIGRSASEFTNNLDVVSDYSPEGSVNLHTAIRYGLSQALLDAAACSEHRTKAEILSELYGSDLSESPISLYAQTGPNHKEHADKMILKNVPVLPHASFHNLKEVGTEGEKVVEYTRWLSNRITEYGETSYSPSIHIDVYGQIGALFGKPSEDEAIFDYFSKLYQSAQPYDLIIEAPLDEPNQESHITEMRILRSGLAKRGIDVALAADEWCNSLEDIKKFVDADATDYVQVKAPDLGEITNCMEAIMYCDDTNTRSFLGGSANETDISARCSAHVALASKPEYIMARPGVGVDEALMIVQNEMLRTIQRYR